MKTVVLCIALVSGLSVAAQEKPKPILAVEFAEANCDELISRVDQLVEILIKYPQSRGVAVFYPQADAPGPALLYEEFLRRGLAFRKIEPGSVDFVRGKPLPKTKVQFWAVPLGADQPLYVAAQPGEMFTQVKKPFIYNTEWGGEACPSADPRLMADVLQFNPGVVVKVLVRAKTRSTITRKTNKWLYELVFRQKIPRNRVRVAWSRKLEEYYPYEDVEFWFVPPRSR